MSGAEFINSIYNTKEKSMRLRIIIAAIVLLPAAFLFNGCALGSITTNQPIGVIYQDTRAPEVVQPANIVAGEKVGTATSQSILGLVATGDASIEAAMKNGGITKVNSIDHQVYNVLGVYVTHTIIVHGE